MPSNNLGTRLREQWFRENLGEELTRAKRDGNFSVAVRYGSDKTVCAQITVGTNGSENQADCDRHNLIRRDVRDTLKEYVEAGPEDFFADHHLNADNRADTYFILYKERLCDLKAVARVSLRLAADDRLAQSRKVANAVHNLGFTYVHFINGPMKDRKSLHLIEITGKERDGLRYGRSGEGPNHKRLRLWVKKHPDKVEERFHVVRSETEVTLLSGDRVDVVYYGEGKTVAVEVKSIDSDQDDIRRGIYQCVKYEAVMRAQYRAQGKRWSVRSLLVTESPLDDELKQIVERLKVECQVVSVNRGKTEKRPA